MAQPVTVPDPLTLVPPLLAFLPTSFASPRPPPALLPLLSPILRQRLHIHTSSPSNSHDSWLRLLCWDAAKADRLKDTLENTNFEPHPASGEVEVGDVDSIKYKRFDHETLKAHLPLTDWELSAMYLWCTGADDGDGWKLAELLPFDSDLIRDTTWFNSIQEAEDVARPKSTLQVSRAIRPGGSRKLSVQGGDDDDYWAMYDSTPGRTPARKPSTYTGQATIPEEDYFARYGNVQPALDGHDPDEETDENIESGLNGNALQEMLARNTTDTAPAFPSEQQPSMFPLSTFTEEEEESSVPVRQPSPSSPRSRAGSDTVQRLESQVEMYAASEIGIRHHIGYSVKSMFRLAKSAGISRQDFEDMVQRELETLSIIDEDV